ncbi:hypothetical protein ACHAW5_005590 [Stephanodiscus triporus]|uniref:Uncharacterized protein n=1 Tax=Stephanodiscus triporus TaxID=2934178 RepID=A0ABD3P3L7_9STRA
MLYDVNFSQGEHTDAAEAFCSAAVATTTTEAPPTTTEAPPATTEAPPTTTEAPPVTTEAPPTTTEAPPVTTEAPIEIDMSMSLSTPSLFGAKSGKAKALKSKAHAKTEKNTMAKVYKAKESDAKSGKSKALKDAKAEKELPSSKSGKRAKTAYHMFSKGNKMSMPAQSSMSL